MNILFTCAGRRNYLIKYFRTALNGVGNIYAADMQISAPALVEADKAFVVPSIYEKNYITEIKNICIEESVDAVFSLNDLELPILSLKKKEFEQIGTKLVISSPDIIDICYDKMRTIIFAKSTGLNTPKTFVSFDQCKIALYRNEISYPLVIKPRWGSASIGIEYINSESQLEVTYSFLYQKLQHTILGDNKNNKQSEALIIQEKLKGDEYGVDILNDLNGELKAIYIKKKLAMRAGETDKAVLVNCPEIEVVAYKIGKKLKHIGNLDCDLFYNDKVYLLEMNARFGGGFPFTYQSGGDYPGALVKLLQGEEVNNSHFVKKYGLTYSKCDELIQVSY